MDRQISGGTHLELVLPIVGAAVAEAAPVLAAAGVALQRVCARQRRWCTICPSFTYLFFILNCTFFHIPGLCTSICPSSSAKHPWAKRPFAPHRYCSNQVVRAGRKNANGVYPYSTTGYCRVGGGMRKEKNNGKRIISHQFNRITEDNRTDDEE